MVSKGKFIVFEGIDGAGSTTQVLLLYDYLKKKKIPVIKTAEPTESTIGKQIRGILQGKAKVSPKALQMLYCADRINHLAEEIVPAVNHGKTVVCDRYYWSTIAYGSLKIEKDWLIDATKDFMKADITFYIDTPARLAMNRMKSRKSREHFEKEKWLAKVGKNYLEIVDKDNTAFALDGKLPKEKIFEEVLRILQKKKLV